MKHVALLLAVLISGCNYPPFLQSSKTTVHLYGEINEFSAENFLIQMKDAVKLTAPNGIIDIYINSPGGSVLDGYRIIEAIKAAQAKGFEVNTVCTEMCASMGAIILEFGTHRYATSTSFILFHNVYYAGDPTRRDNNIMVLQHAALQWVAQRTGIPEMEWIKAYMLFGDLSFSCTEAKAMNLIDKVITLELEDI